LTRRDSRVLLACGFFASTFVVLTLLVAADVAQPVDRYAVRHLMPGLGADFQKPSLPGRLIPFLGEAQRHADAFQHAIRVISFPASALASLVLLTIACFLLWRRGERPSALTWTAVWALAIAIELICEALVRHEPLLLASPDRAPRQVTFGNSYPSGHAIRATLLAALAGRLSPRVLPYVLVWTAVVAVGLELAAFHTPTDILGGLLLAAFLLASAKLVSRILSPPRP
jgi:membrane-associated phospholipid phosphatase